MQVIRIPPYPHLLILQSLAGVISALTQGQTCYNPDGSVESGDFPCFLDQNQSSCCGLNSICVASGLCKPKGSQGVSELIRGSCTDQTWHSPECTHLCIFPGAEAGGINVISCENVTQSYSDFCCDHQAGCCDSGIGRFQIPLNADIVTFGPSGATVSTIAPMSTTLSVRPTTTTQSTSTTSSSSSMTLSATGPLSTTSSNPSSNSGASATNTAPTSASSSAQLDPSNKSTVSQKSAGLSTGAVAGLAVGCTIVGIVFLGALVYCLRYKRRRTELVGTNVESFGDKGLSPNNYASDPIAQTYPAEIMTSWDHRPPELQA